MIQRLLILLLFLPSLSIAQSAIERMADGNTEESVVVEKDAQQKEDTEEKEEEVKEPFLSFDYEFEEGNPVPISFSLLEVLFGLSCFLITVGVPIIIIWKKARELGVNDMGSSSSFGDNFAPDGHRPKGNPLAKYLEPGIESIELPKTNYSQKAASYQSPEVEIKKEVLHIDSMPQGSGLTFDEYIQSLMDQHYLIQEVNVFTLPVKPHGRSFMGAESQKVLILPRMECTETIAMALQQHDQVIVFVNEKTIFEIRNVAS